MLKKLIPILLAFLFIGVASPAYADLIVGENIVTLGEDLTDDQEAKLLEEFGVNRDDVTIVYVTNDEEHKYLGGLIPDSQIGTRAISSSLITVGEEGSGIVVETNNISYVTSDMYVNALTTAGVQDVKVQVSAPFKVSGTGALTGIIKAYEQESGEKINDDQIRVANEEMVQTSELVRIEGIPAEKANDLIDQVKERIAKENPQTVEEIRVIIEEVASGLGITLSEERLQQLIDLFNRIKDLNIDWDKVNRTIDAAKDKWDEFAASEEGQGIIDAIINFFKAIWDWIVSLFQK